MASKKKRAGRPGSDEVIRNLLSLAASLSECGDFVSEEAIEKRVGCSPKQAAKLYGLLRHLSARPDGIATYEDEDGLVLISGGGRGRALRLDAKETIALVSALKFLGIEEEHPLRAKLQGSLADGTVNQALIKSMLAASPAAEDAETLETCSGAIAALRDLRFMYRKPGTPSELRIVRPERISQADGAWHLHGIDLNKQAERVFRLDRIGEVIAVARTEDAIEGRRDTEPRKVEVVFHDTRFLSLFQWPGLEVDEDAAGEGEVSGTLPYFGGMWLPRQLAACGGTVEVGDDEVAGLMRSYAQGLLSSAK